MTPGNWIALIGAGVALCGLGLHVITYAFREGANIQRLAEVERKVAKIETTDGALQLLALEVKHLGERLSEVSADTSKKFDEIQHSIKSLMMRPPARRRAGED